MAILRYDINGDLSAFKTALQHLVPSIFASVAFDDDESPTAILCKDASDNLLFKIEYPVNMGTVTGWSFTAYKSGGETVSCAGAGTTATGYGSPTYLYSVGAGKALIHFAYSASSAACLVIGKTNTGKVGFVMPPVMINNSSGNTEIRSAHVCSWDDDGSKTSDLQITGTTAMVGNSNELVPVPLHGTYDSAIYLEGVYFLPIAQTGLRGVVQQLTANDKVYLGNGYVEVLDS